MSQNFYVLMFLVLFFSIVWRLVFRYYTKNLTVEKKKALNERSVRYIWIRCLVLFIIGMCIYYMSPQNLAFLYVFLAFVVVDTIVTWWFPYR